MSALFHSERQWRGVADGHRSAVNPPHKCKLLAATTLGAFMLCLAGCRFGDPIAQRTVSLSFLAPSQQVNMSLSPTNAEVLEALGIIDGVMVREGFTRDQKPLAAEDRAQGIIVAYGRYSVLLRDGTLTVNFVEFGQRHSSSIVKRVCRELKEELSKRFGGERVREESGTTGMRVSMSPSGPPNQAD